MAVINLASTISSIPLLTRILCALLFSLSVLLFLLRVTQDSIHWFQFSRNDSAIAFPALVIVPGVSFWYPWTLVTSAFCETTFTEFLISAVSLPLAGRYLERIWGPVELAKFTLIVIVGSNIIAWFIALVLFVVLGSEVAFYGTQYHGLEALQTAFLVAFAHLIPDHQIQFWRLPSVRVRDLPMAYVTFSNIACIIGYTSPFILIQFGWLISWIYLRFYRYNPDTGIRGDPSEAFTLVSWFPPFLHVPVTYISNFLHGIALRLKLIPDFTKYEALSSDDLEAANGLDARAEAERRRAMALKALDQRVRVGSGSGDRLSRSNSSASTTTNRPVPASAPASQVVFEAPKKLGEEEDAEWPSSDEEQNSKQHNGQRIARDNNAAERDGDAEEDEGDLGVSSSSSSQRSKGKMQD